MRRDVWGLVGASWFALMTSGAFWEIALLQSPGTGRTILLGASIAGFWVSAAVLVISLVVAVALALRRYSRAVTSPEPFQVTERDGLCPTCGHQAGTPNLLAPVRAWLARRFGRPVSAAACDQSDGGLNPSGWSEYCLCRDPFHGS